jgi:hypothetical protein
VVSFTPRPLYPRGKSPRYLFDRRLGGPRSRSQYHNSCITKINEFPFNSVFCKCSFSKDGMPHLTEFSAGNFINSGFNWDLIPYEN